MTTKTGQIKVQTADIFPIIKKWLYSEHDIFIRELVANATDAITKRATLATMKGEEVPTGTIKISVNKDLKTVTITDNGLGMTEAEVEKYIAQLAFSGAEEFVKNMKDQGMEKGSDIIGKFGLGFYSCFMVSEKVTVESLSMNAGSKATKWTCHGQTDYTFEESTWNEVGTKITLFINQESEEFLNHWKLVEVLRQYCDFLPHQITVADELNLTRTTKDKDGKDVVETVEATVINETTPIWKKDPTTLTDQDYKDFYRKLYPMDGEPLFWLHLKVDHPFTLEGVLFFPKLNPNKPFQEKNIRLYCKQVFVSDNVKNIIPEFLSLLKGTIDSSDIPLNVSRSSLQGDPNIKKISNYIIKKVAESLKKLFRNDRAQFEKIWEDIGVFVKYGCISDEKFDEAMREMVLFRNSEGNYTTLPEYAASVPDAYKEKMKNKVIYFEKAKSDVSLRDELLTEKIQTIETDEMIDPHFMQHTEYKKVGELEYKYGSVDSEVGQIFTRENTTDEDMKIKDLFAKFLAPATDKKPDESNPFAGTDSMSVEIEKLKNNGTPAYFKIDEQSKRFAQMAKSMGNTGMNFPIKKTLVVNPNNALIKNVFKLSEKETNNTLVEKLCKHVEDLALISSEGLKAEEKELFVKRGQELLQILTENRI